MTSVFLSYARGDDDEPYASDRSFVTRLYKDLTSAGLDVWFDRVSMPSRGLTFHQEIRDAIAAHDRLLLVVGPNAAASDYVRQEWQFAWFEAEKVITPILRSGDYPLIPDELKLLHCEDFRDETQYEIHLANLVRQLREPPPPMGKLVGVPSLPAHYLSRAEKLIPLRDALRSGLDSPAPLGGVTARHQFHGIAGASKHIGMHGMGGIGKTVLATLLAHDRKIREAFSDGIVWVGLGAAPNLSELMRRVQCDLGGDGAFTTEHEGKSKLKELFAQKSVLLVIDDAWRRPDVDAFDVLGPRCRALVTTRDAGLLTSLGGTHHLVELLTDAEAQRLLAVAANQEVAELPSKAHDVLTECGHLPLAVALAGGMVASGMPWSDVYEGLREHELEFVSDDHRPEQHQNLWKMIEVSVKSLGESDQTRLVELAVFPEDEAVPDAAVATLWESSGGLSGRETRKLLVELKQRSLVQLTAAPELEAANVGRVSIHDLIHDYCVRRAQAMSGGILALHDNMLTAYQRKCSGGWASGPNDGYFLEHLRTHLVAAGRSDELADLLHELPWLETKNSAELAFDLPNDFAVSIATLPADDDRRRILKLLDEALRRDIHFIANHAADYPQGLFQCLWNSGWWYDCPEAARHYVEPSGGWHETPPWSKDGVKLCDLLQSWRVQKQLATSEFPWLRAVRPPLNPLGKQQLVEFRGDNWLHLVGFDSGTRRVVAAGQAVRVWEYDTGRELFCFGVKETLDGNEVPTEMATISPDGTQFAGVCFPNTLILSNIHGDPSKRVTIRGINRRAISYSANGDRVHSVEDDGFISIDAVTGKVLSRIAGHHATVSPDGLRFARISPSRTVEVLAVDTGEVLVCMDGEASHSAPMIFSPDGNYLAYWSRYRILHVLNVETKKEVCFLTGEGPKYLSIITSLAFSQDSRLLAAGHHLGAMQIWEIPSGREHRCIDVHPSAVNGLAFSFDGARIAAFSRFAGLVKIWDVATGNPVTEFHHEGHLQCVAFSTDNQYFVTGCFDGTVRVWDLRTAVPSESLHRGFELIDKIAISRDGTFIATSDFDGTLRLWNPESGVVERNVRGYGVSVSNLRFTEDGLRLRIALNDDELRLLDFRNNKMEDFTLDGGPEFDEPDPWVFESSKRWRQAHFGGIGSELWSTTESKRIACFPDKWRKVFAHPSDRTWIGLIENSLRIVRLEGTE